MDQQICNASPEPDMEPVEHAPKREPWVAVLYSQFLPGLGQWYAGNIRNAALYFLIANGLFAAGVWFLFSPGGSLAVALACFICCVGVGVGNLFDAFDSAKAANGAPSEAFRKQNKDPWLAVFLTLIFPGLGHFYNRRVLWGVVFVSLGVAAAMAENGVHGSGLMRVAAGLGFAAVAFGACVHALASCPGMNPGRARIRSAALLVAALTLVRGPMLSATIKHSVVQSCIVPTSSMEPTIVSGDRIFVSRVLSRAPRRGDIVVFQAPKKVSSNKAPFVKRVIAVPGDMVSRSPDMDLVVNGVQISRDMGTTLDLAALESIPEAGKSGGESDAHEGVLVGRGQMYVVGDNLGNSYDSRMYGPVPAAGVQGYAFKTFWPPEHARPLR